jgi:DNA invertase Pin-like site-specific DNA recombinase
VAYVRVSTDQQVESGLSLASQQERLQAWATTQGDVELVDIVTDAGESARNLDRPGVARVLGMIDSRAVDVVLGDLLDRLQAADVALVSLTENLDTSTASGRMIVGMLGVVAQWEREIISERTRDALHVKRSRGERFTNVAPTGFRFVDSRMVQDDSETRMLNALREMGHGVGDDSMMSLRDMSRALAAAGYLSRTGKPLTAAQVSRLLNRMQRETVAA